MFCNTTEPFHPSRFWINPYYIIFFIWYKSKLPSDEVFFGVCTLGITTIVSRNALSRGYALTVKLILYFFLTLFRVVFEAAVVDDAAFAVGNVEGEGAGGVSFEKVEEGGVEFGEVAGGRGLEAELFY